MPTANTRDRRTLGLPRVEPKNLSREVFEILRRRIASGQIAAGTRLFEVDVAESLGVSRGPLREALRQLEQEGFIQSFPRRGAIVVSIPEAELETFYELRADIEAAAFAIVCQNATEADFDHLAGLVEDIHTAMRNQDVEGDALADYTFHGTVVEMAGFTLLRRIWQTVDGPLRLRTYQFVEFSPPGGEFVETGDAQHHHLLAALRGGAPEAAARLARQHILEVRDLIRDIAPGIIDPSLAGGRLLTRSAGPKGGD